MSRNITIPVQVGLKGRFRLVRTCAATGEVRQDTGWFDNLIVNSGLDLLGSTLTNNPSPFGGCVVGSGNTPPVAGDTGLESFVAGTRTLQAQSRTNNTSVAPFYSSLILTYRFGEGVAAGNLSEVGIAYVNYSVTTPTGASPLFSRALIVDGGGVPTTITVLSDEFLDVIWELRMYPPDDVVGSFNLDILGVPTSHNYTIRPGWISNANTWQFSDNTDMRAFRPLIPVQNASGGTESKVTGGTLGLVTGDITGTVFPVGQNGTRDLYVAGNYYVDLHTTYTLNFGNVSGGIDAIGLGLNAVYFQMIISPAIDKTASRIFTITVRVSWANRP